MVRYPHDPSRQAGMSHLTCRTGQVMETGMDEGTGADARERREMDPNIDRTGASRRHVGTPAGRLKGAILW